MKQHMYIRIIPEASTQKISGNSPEESRHTKTM